MAGKARKFIGMNQFSQRSEQKGINRNINTYSLYQSSPKSSQSITKTTSMMPRIGAPFAGPFSSIDDTLTIDTGILNIGSSDGLGSDRPPLRRRYFVDPEGAGTTDTLDLIDANGREVDGMEIILMGIGSNAITITHNSGLAAGNDRAIICPSATDYTLSNQEAVYLVYDAGNSEWILLGTASRVIADGDTSVVVNNTTPQIQFKIEGNVEFSMNKDGSGNYFLLVGTDNYINMSDEPIINLTYISGSENATDQFIRSNVNGWQYDVDTGEFHDFQVNTSSIANVNGDGIDITNEKGIQASSGFTYFACGSTKPDVTDAANVGALQIPYKESLEDSPSAATLQDWFGDQNGCIGLQYDGDSPGTFTLWVRMNDQWVREILT